MDEESGNSILKSLAKRAEFPAPLIVGVRLQRQVRDPEFCCCRLASRYDSTSCRLPTRLGCTRVRKMLRKTRRLEPLLQMGPLPEDRQEMVIVLSKRCVGWSARPD